MKKLRWKIIFEDDDIIIIDKPAKLLTIPDRYDSNIENLFSSLKENREGLLINHRLDKDTSGLILFSKNEETHKKMSDIFESRQIEKIYMAILNYTPDLKSGKIDMPISSSNSAKKEVEIDEAGKPAVSYFEVLESFKRHSLVKVKIETGRMHQIRVHMKSIYCPIICDDLYGDGKPFMLSDIKVKYKKNRNEDERPLINRVALHSHSLSFKHPNTNKKIHVESELPKDMKAAINQLRRNSKEY